MVKKARMGRNLEALLGGAVEAPPRPPVDAPLEAPPASADAAPAAGPPPSATGVSAEANFSPSAIPPDDAPPPAHYQHGDRLERIGVERIRRGAYQPRRHFDPVLLQELADSLRVQGVIQPILVRPVAGAYELIAGERRWRAAQLAGIAELPAIVRTLDDASVAAVSLIENIQRKDLNPLEEAEALRRLSDEFGMTHGAVAEAVGRSRAAVSNLLRLLDLHDEVKRRVDDGVLDMGHARALLGAPLADQPALARQVVDEALSVRATERLVRERRDRDDDHRRVPDNSPASTADPDIERLRRSLGDLLGASVRIRHREGGGGRLEISYTSVAELEGILSHIR